MEDRLRRDMWWASTLKGMAAILFGVVAVFWPDLTLATLVYLFGGYVLATGLVGLITGLTNLASGATSFLSRILMLALGIGEVGVGVYLLQNPDASFVTFILIAGILLVVRGVIDLFNGVFEAGRAADKAAIVTSGLVAGVAGVVLLFQPEAEGVAFVWILGLYAILIGAMQLASAYEAKTGALTATTRTVRKRA